MIHEIRPIPHIKHRVNSIYLDTYARRWSEKSKSGKWDSILDDKRSYVNEDRSYERFKDVAVELFQDLKPKSVLDIGCGNAVMWQYLLRFVDENNMYGIDVAEDMVEKANEKYPHAHFYIADARRLEELIAKTIRFDAVISRGAVCSHMGLPFFSEILKATNDYAKGIIVFDYVNSKYFSGSSRKPSFQLCTEKEMRAFLKTTNYADKDVEIIDANRRDPIVVLR